MDKTNKLLCVIDIDGTIADLSVRLEAAGAEPQRGNRQAFQEWLDRLQNDESLASDQPVKQLKHMLNVLNAGWNCHLIYLTGRSEKYRKTTQEWLLKHDFPYSTVIMRSEEDWRPAAKYKEQKLLALQRSGYDAIVTIDDDGSGDCSEMYQRLGIVHLKKMNRWDLK